MPHSIPSSRSAYYPPRAGRLRAPRRMVQAARAVRCLERIHLPSVHGLRRTLAAALIPGLAFHYSGPRLVAKIIWFALPLLVLAFLAGLGTFASEVAFTLIISAHVTSVSHLLRPLMIRNRLWLQLVFGVVLFVGASVLFYIPAREWFHNHVAMPLSVRGQTLVINPRADPASINRGDWVAYRIDDWTWNNIRVREGMGAGPALGLPGDRLVFGNGMVQVNGSVHPLPGSSRELEPLDVPEFCWFIWPELDIANPGIAFRDVQQVIRGLALVDRERYVGRPYRWWFFRAQGTS